MGRATVCLAGALAAAALVAVAGGGCGPTYVIERPAAPPQPLYGRVSIEVSDRREPKRGGNDPSLIGNQRSAFGIPYPIRLEGAGALAFQIHDLLAREALAAQVGVLPLGQAAGATSRMIVEIQSYWCDGYPPVFKADAVASATIVDGGGGQVRVPGFPLRGHGEAGACRYALRQLTAELAASARGLFVDPQLRAALVAEQAGVSPPPPPSPPAAQQPQNPY